VVGHDQIDDVCTHDKLLHVVGHGWLRQRSLYPHWTDPNREPLTVAGTVPRPLGVPDRVRRAAGGRPQVRRPDTSLAERLLGWHPRVTWQKGLAGAVAWFADGARRTA
jgi:nucleoside-diphosphate-sugar epimerase